MFKCFHIVLLALPTLMCAIPISAATIRVPTDAPNLSAAISMSAPGDEILLADGTYTGNENRMFLSNRSLTIRSESGNPDACIVGDNGATTSSNLIDIRRDPQGLIRIADLTLRGEVRMGDYSSPSFSQVCKSVIDNCRFRGDDTVIRIEGTDSTPTIKDCLFVDNVSSSSIVARDFSHPRIINCRFLGNNGGNAGAAQIIDDGKATFINCEFIGNTSNTFYGAIWMRFTVEVNLINCSFVENMGGSGTIRVGGGNLGGNVLNVYNCLFWNNRNGSGTANELTQISVNTADTLPSTVNIMNSTLTGWTGSFGGVGNNGSDPLLIDVDGADGLLGTEDDDVRLGAGSPAIDSGDNTLLAGVFIDLDGDARFEDDAATTDTGTGTAPIIDRGAYEFGMATAPIINDCNGNAIEDSTEIADGLLDDCNNNGKPDSCDLKDGTSDDCNGNQIPDDCDLASGFDFDCNANGVLDFCDLIINATSLDCNENSVPDECDIAANDSDDINTNGVPDECDLDCNNSGTPDDYDIEVGDSDDCNGNGIPDECDVSPQLQQIDFEFSTLALDDDDSCDECQLGDIDLPWPVEIQGQTFVAFAMSSDGYVELLQQGESSYEYGAGEVDDLIEEDDPDHTYLMAAYDDLSSDYAGFFGYGALEDRVTFTWLTETYDDEDDGELNLFQIVLYADGRVQWNFVFADYDDNDEDLFSGIYIGGDEQRLLEIIRDDIPEEESWLFADSGVDCNRNGVPDSCEIAAGDRDDCNANGTPDECEFAAGTVADCNNNLVPDDCETLDDCDNDGTPDVCEVDSDGDGFPDDCDVCEGNDDNADTDGDGMPNACDECPNDAVKMSAGACGCDVADTDSDGDGVPDCFDQCPNDPNKIAAGSCGCGNTDADDNADGVPDCIDLPAAPAPTPDNEMPDDTPTDDQSDDDDNTVDPNMCGMGGGMGMMAALVSLASMRRSRRQCRKRRCDR